MDRVTLPSDHRARSASWLFAAALGAVASVWLGYWLSNHPEERTLKPVAGVFVIGGVAIWMAFEWWRLHRMRLRMEESRFIFTEGADVHIVSWDDVLRIERQQMKGGLAGLTLTTPRGALRLPKELEGFGQIIAELEARAKNAEWVQTNIATLMGR